MNMKAKEDAKPATFEGWACLEQMGHTVRWGYVTEVVMFGQAMGRIDIHDENCAVTSTEFFGGSSVFRMTPTTKDAVLAAMKPYRPPTPRMLPRARVHSDDGTNCVDAHCMDDHEDPDDDSPDAGAGEL